MNKSTENPCDAMTIVEQWKLWKKRGLSESGGELHESKNRNWFSFNHLQALAQHKLVHDRERVGREKRNGGCSDLFSTEFEMTSASRHDIEVECSAYIQTGALHHRVHVQSTHTSDPLKPNRKAEKLQSKNELVRNLIKHGNHVNKEQVCKH